MTSDEQWMQHALTLAESAAIQNEVPVGAIVVANNHIIGEGWNQPIALHDPTAHAEILALRSAALTVKNYRLTNTTLYVTLEPCAMCLGAILHARCKRLVFGAWDPRAGAVGSVFTLLDEPKLNHKILWTDGIKEKECREILKNFFIAKRI